LKILKYECRSNVDYCMCFVCLYLCTDIVDEPLMWYTAVYVLKFYDSVLSIVSKSCSPTFRWSMSSQPLQT